MKKQKANIESQMTQNLISLLSDLENCDRQRMSSSGKEYLDRIWTLLGLPTYDKIVKMNEELESMDTETEEFPFKPNAIPNTEESK
tara:strand:- start:506 stop:763 length:258 start_codon:yes stop_codon:yes gene_type:complete